MLQTPMRRARRIVAAVITFCAFAGAVHAAPITYTLAGTASGSLGAKSFVDLGFAVTVDADTSAVGAAAPGVPCNDPTGVSYAIAGLASGTVTTPVSVADNGAWQLVALARGRCTEAGPMWANGRNTAFASYDLASGLGPVALDAPSAPPGVAVDTPDGKLVLTSLKALTFTARVAAPGAAAAQVPAPSAALAVPTLAGPGLGALALVVGGIGAVVLRRRRGR